MGGVKRRDDPGLHKGRTRPPSLGPRLVAVGSEHMRDDRVQAVAEGPDEHLRGAAGEALERAHYDVVSVLGRLRVDDGPVLLDRLRRAKPR